MPGSPVFQPVDSARKPQSAPIGSVELKILKGYVRRSRKRGSRYLSIKNYETASKYLSEIGRLTGGLINKEKVKTAPYTHNKNTIDGRNILTGVMRNYLLQGVINV